MQHPRRICIGRRDSRITVNGVVRGRNEMKAKILFAVVLLSILSVLSIVSVNVNKVHAAPTFSVYMDPDVNIYAPGTSFNVIIKIAGVPNLWSWEFNVTWSPVYLTLVSAANSTFLSTAGETFSTLTYSQAQGWVLVGETRIGGTAQASGFGDLAILGFTVKAGVSGQTSIHFQDSLLLYLDAGSNLQTYPRTDYELHDSMWKYPVTFLTGDVNKDGKVNIMDLSRIGTKYTQTGSAGWIPEDVVADGKIDISDLAACAKNYGKYV